LVTRTALNLPVIDAKAKVSDIIYSLSVALKNGD